MRELTIDYILGNEKQLLVWMANLATERYSDYWYYFDKAFTNYGLHEKLFTQDKNGTFKKHYDQLSSKLHSRQEEFEEVVKILYPKIIITKK